MARVKKFALPAVFLVILLAGYQIFNTSTGRPSSPSSSSASFDNKSSRRGVAEPAKRGGEAWTQTATDKEPESRDSTGAAGGSDSGAARASDPEKSPPAAPKKEKPDKAADNNRQKPTATKPVASLPKSLSPLAFLPGSAPGYEVKNEWLAEPAMAGATYLPVKPDLREQVERVFVTVEKLSSDGRAEKRLDRERKNLSLSPVSPRYKEISAYTGESAGLAALAWTQENWFFSIQVIPDSASPRRQADIAWAIFKLLVGQTFN